MWILVSISDYKCLSLWFPIHKVSMRSYTHTHAHTHGHTRTNTRAGTQARTQIHGDILPAGMKCARFVKECGKQIGGVPRGEKK